MIRRCVSIANLEVSAVPGPINRGREPGSEVTPSEVQILTPKPQGNSKHQNSMKRTAIRASCPFEAWRLSLPGSLGFGIWCFAPSYWFKMFQQSHAFTSQLVFQALGAITFAARPQLRPVLMPAIFSRMRVFHAEQLEIFFPIRPFLIQRRITETSFDPCGGAGFIQACLLHIIEILITGDVSLAERLVFYRPQQPGITAAFNLCLNQIAHS